MSAALSFSLASSLSTPEEKKKQDALTTSSPPPFRPVPPIPQVFVTMAFSKIVFR